MNSPAALRIVVAATSLAAAGQTPTPGYRTATELVRITATVTDSDGHLVTNLEQDDFAVTDEGAPQHIALFTRDADTPVSVVVLLDVSGSMEGSFEAARRGLRGFAAAAGADDQIALMTFDSRAHLLSGLDEPRDRLIASLDALQTGGGTALYRAVIDASAFLQRGTHRKKVLLVVSDGQNTSHGTSRRAARKAFERTEAILYAIGLGHGDGISVGGRLLAALDSSAMGIFRTLSDASGGRTELLPNTNDRDQRLSRTITAFGEELHQQYTLGYYPPALTSEKEVHLLRVTTRRPGLVVRARKMYLRPDRGSG